MTDEEGTALDRARAKQAHETRYDKPGLLPWAQCTEAYKDALTSVARLARTGWKPEDPLLKEAREIACQHSGASEYNPFVALALKALRRGVEIGRAEK